MIDLEELGIKAKLTMWGRWVGRGNIVASPVGGGSVGSCSPMGYKSAWSFILPSDGGGVDVGYDDEMLEIEHAMSYLKIHDSFSYRLIKLKYRYGYSYQRLAQKLTKLMPEYRRGGSKAGSKMCDKYCKKLVDTAEQAVISEIKNVAES